MIPPDRRHCFGFLDIGSRPGTDEGTWKFSFMKPTNRVLRYGLHPSSCPFQKSTHQSRPAKVFLSAEATSGGTTVPTLATWSFGEPSKSMVVQEPTSLPSPDRHRGSSPAAHQVPSCSQSLVCTCCTSVPRVCQWCWRQVQAVLARTKSRRCWTRVVPQAMMNTAPLTGTLHTPDGKRAPREQSLWTGDGLFQPPGNTGP